MEYACTVVHLGQRQQKARRGHNCTHQVEGNVMAKWKEIPLGKVKNLFMDAQEKLEDEKMLDEVFYKVTGRYPLKGEALKQSLNKAEDK
jgi:hypothetical protein